MHHKLNITPRIESKAYSKVHGVFPSAISISIFTIIQFHWIYTRTVGKSLPFVHVGTYPTGNFATLDRHSYSRLYQWFRRVPNIKKKLYEKCSRLATDTGQVSDLYIIITLSSPVFLINSRYPLFCAITHKKVFTKRIIYFILQQNILCALLADYSLFLLELLRENYMNIILMVLCLYVFQG